ncbi:MAG: porin [Methylophilaceae bacterium]|nr:porin [Methyloradius sp.]
MMTFRLNKSILSAAVIAACSIPAYNANAGGTISFGEDKSVTVGFGFRGSFTAKEDAANGGKDYSQDFSLDNARIYLSGSLNQYIKGMFTYEEKPNIADNYSGATRDKVIDANVQLKVLPELTVWVGRMLSPSDRANMAGPFYSLGGGWGGGDITARYSYNGGYIGRDDGVALVGSFLNEKVTYAVGAYEGHKEFAISPLSPAQVLTLNNSTANQDDGLLYAGRVQVDFWDAEGATLYGTGDYRGGKDILAVGLSGKTQKNGASVIGQNADYNQYSADFLLEKKDVGPGAVHLEAAYYDYDTDGAILSEQGKAYSAGAGYIFKEKVGWGQIQPFTRYQKFDSDAVATTERKYDLGVAYIIEAYNAEITGTYTNDKLQNLSSTDKFMVSTQFQF